MAKDNKTNSPAPRPPARERRTSRAPHHGPRPKPGAISRFPRTRTGGRQGELARLLVDERELVHLLADETRALARVRAAQASREAAEQAASEAGRSHHLTTPEGVEAWEGFKRAAEAHRDNEKEARKTLRASRGDTKSTKGWWTKEALEGFLQDVQHKLGLLRGGDEVSSSSSTAAA